MLDFQKLSPQLSSLRTDVQKQHTLRQRRVGIALDALRKHSDEWQSIREKLEKQKRVFQVGALPTGSLGSVSPLPAIPHDYTVFSTDGSQIDLERHQSVPCFLINLGTVVLSYGAASNALLESDAQLFSSDADLFIGAGRKMIQPALIAAKRDIQEMKQAAVLAKTLQADSSVVGMLDGTLIRWTLETFDTQLKQTLLTEYLDSLSDLKKMSVPVCSYISSSGSKEIIDLLQYVLCPHDEANCEKCRASQERTMSSVRDQDIFAHTLKEGERSAIFESRSGILEHYGIHRVHFFYLNVGMEVARIEIPAWVALDTALLDRVHAVCFDQAVKGHGYPIALAEAHEQAVVTHSDRETFFMLVAQELKDTGAEVRISEKALSKRIKMV